MKTSIIIPAFNEGKTIGILINKLKEYFQVFEVIVVNDGSIDYTEKVAKDAGAIVYSHPYNMGNGAAIKTGIRNATGDVLVFMDGDNQHNPEEIDELLKHVPKYDMVVGARIREGQANVMRSIGNRIYNRFASYVAKFKVEDLTSGFRAVKVEVARKFLYMLPNSYSYPTTLTLGVLRSGLSLKYVPISINKRTKGKSGIKLFKDGVRFFMIIIKICTLYSPMRVFLPVSFSLFLLGLIRYVYTYLTQRLFTNMSALLFIASIIIFMMGLVSEQICQMRYERSETNLPSED